MKKSIRIAEAFLMCGLLMLAGCKESAGGNGNEPVKETRTEIVEGENRESEGTESMMETMTSSELDTLANTYSYESKDKKWRYVVTDMGNCGIGWTTNYVLYRMNTGTGQVEELESGAAVSKEGDELRLAVVTRCTTPDAQFGYETEYAFKDVWYNVNTQKKREGKEYDGKELTKRYGEDLCTLKK